MGHTVPTLPAGDLSLRTARPGLCTAAAVVPTKPLTFPARAEDMVSRDQLWCRAWPAQGVGAPPSAPTHQLPQSFCSTVPGGKKLPPHSQGQAASSRQTPPEGTDSRAPAKGAPRHLVAPLHPHTQSPLPSAHSDPTHRAAESPRGRSSPPHRRRPGRATQARDCGRGTWRGTWGHRPHTPGPPHTAELGGEERGLGHHGARAPGSNSSGRASPKRDPWRALGYVDGVDVLPGACQGYLQHSSDLSMFGSSRTASGS